ncbi:MAG: hypothetical protein ABTD50_04675 [Polyangiaceae bacterium]|jgi:hypothetical protein
MKFILQAVAISGIALVIRRADACSEVSSVVGYRRCSSFGAGWDRSHAPADPPVLVGARRSVFALRSYRPGTLVEAPDEASGGGRKLGCLEIRAERVADEAVPASSAVLAFTFGNACDRPVRIALQNARVVARRDTENDAPRENLTLYDPASEAKSLSLDGRDQAREVLQFDSAARGSPAQGIVCVDLSGVAPDAAVAPVQPVCTSVPHELADEHEVVGHNWTFPFGDGWGPRVAFFVEVQALAQSVDLSQGTYASTQADSHKFALPGGTFGRAASYALDMRTSIRLAGPVYVGLLFRMGAGRLATGAPSQSDATGVRPDSSFLDLAVGGLAGLMLGHFEGVRLRAEVGAGVRALDVLIDSMTCNAQASCEAIQGRGLVEPRLVLDAWLTPWWSVGASVGLEALQPSDGFVGLSLAFHVRNFDGEP